MGSGGAAGRVGSAKGQLFVDLVLEGGGHVLLADKHAYNVAIIRSYR